MISVSENYKTLASADTRKIEAKVIIGGVTYTGDSIIDLHIYRSIGDSGMAIGNAISDYCTISIATNSRFKSNLSVIPYVRFIGNANSEWLQLGKFTSVSVSYSRVTAEISAYDKMYFLDNRCTYLGNASGTVKALTFPCEMQDLLDYTCAMKGITCDFKCQDWTVQARPVINLSNEGDDRYYTHRQMLGYIAGAHGCNAVFDSAGNLVFRSIGDTTENILPSRCVEQTIDSEELFTVEGIRFTVGDDALFINDTGDLWTEEMPGIIEADNPLASVEIAEYVWHQLGGFSYAACDIQRRGTGWVETGDVIETSDLVTAKQVRIIAQSVEYSFSAETGFMEHIVSNAETETQSGNRTASSSSGSSGGSSSGSGMAVYFNVGSGKVEISNLLSQVVKVQFSAVLTCIPLFAVTIPFTVTTAGTIDFVIVYDGTTAITYSQYCEPGIHFKAINFPLVGTGNGGHTVSVWVKSENAKGIIDSSNTYATVNGSGIQANAAWDGTIRVAETANPIAIENVVEVTPFVQNFYATKYTPIPTNVQIAISGIELSGNNVAIKALNENIVTLIEDIPHEIVTESVQAITLIDNTVTLKTFNDAVITEV